MKKARLRKFLRTRSLSSDVFFRARYVTSAPATPKIAPEAPALTRHGFQATLTMLAASPLIMYITPNRLRPISGSSNCPKLKRHHMLRPIWMMPKWTNVLVNKRQGSVLSVSGPKSAPHRMACTVDGSVHETPDKPIATYTSVLRPMMVSVTTGRGKARMVPTCGSEVAEASVAELVCALALRQS